MLNFTFNSWKNLLTIGINEKKLYFWLRTTFLANFCLALKSFPRPIKIVLSSYCFDLTQQPQQVLK
jgi:hypothetical protein